MKKQYKATWHNTDGNRHELWPIYAKTVNEAKIEAESFMKYRWGKFADIRSLKIQQT